MKTALVTGSSRGIGRAIALRLAKDGYKVIVHGIGSGTKLQEVRDEILFLGGECEMVAANLCDLNDTKRLINSIGDIDVLVLNASLQYKTPWCEITAEAAYEQINCNLVSSLVLMQGVVPYMKKRGWGRIVTIGSVNETTFHPDLLVYSATKSAQTNMAKSLSLQLAPFGITVNNIAPGVIYTDRNIEALSDPVYAQKVIDSIPVGFYGEPNDCAGIVSLLCSEEGRYITGQSIYVDGGKGV